RLTKTHHFRYLLSTHCLSGQSCLSPTRRACPAPAIHLTAFFDVTVLITARSQGDGVPGGMFFAYTWALSALLPSLRHRPGRARMDVEGRCQPDQGGFSMLVLTRRTNETVVIDGEIEVTILAVQGDRVRIG